MSGNVMEFLDQFRAGEALGAASVAAWIRVCKTECLRGGLRTIRMREAMHEQLLEERLEELGTPPKFQLPEAICDQMISEAGATEKSDAEKLKEFIARFPDVEAAIQPILDHADQLDDDQETQSLLRSIAQDERSTLEFLHETLARLDPA